jgi:hypothetical protein
MKYALISPSEADRLCQVEVAPFQVASPLHWVECPDDVSPETHDYIDGGFVAKPPAPEPSKASASGVEEM